MKENKDDRSAQAEQDDASLTPAARAGFLTAPRPQVGNAMPEVRKTAIREGRRKYLLFSRMRCARGYSDIYCAAVSEYSVCGVPVGSRARNNVQTVPRHI